MYNFSLLNRVISKYKNYGCRLRVLNEPSAYLPLGDNVQAVMERFLTLRQTFSLDDFLRGWFRGAPFDKILRRNVEEFMAYAFCCKHWTELSPEVCVFRLVFLSFLPQSARFVQIRASESV